MKRDYWSSKNKEYKNRNQHKIVNLVKRPSIKCVFGFERATEIMWLYGMIEPASQPANSHMEFKCCAVSSCKPFLIFEHFTIVRCCLRMMSMVFGNDFSSMFAFSWFHFNVLKNVAVLLLHVVAVVLLLLLLVWNELHLCNRKSL